MLEKLPALGDDGEHRQIEMRKQSATANHGDDLDRALSRARQRLDR